MVGAQGNVLQNLVIWTLNEAARAHVQVFLRLRRRDRQSIADQFNDRPTLETFACLLNAHRSLEDPPHPHQPAIDRPRPRRERLTPTTQAYSSGPDEAGVVVGRGVVCGDAGLGQVGPPGCVAVLLSSIGALCPAGQDL